MKNKSVQTFTGFIIVTLGFAAIFGLSRFLEQNRPGIPESYIDEDLSLQGRKLKGYSFGFEGLIADWYWMRSLQYIGEKIVKRKSKGGINLENLKPLNPRLLYPLLNSATDLDPRFFEVYSYGAIVLPAINPEQAIKIAEKGITNNPEQWRLYQHLGFIYWKLTNYKKAAEVYEKGSKITGAPEFMRYMAARMETEGGSRQTARQIYQEMLSNAKDTQTRENAEIRLLELDSQDERDAIRNALKEFKIRNGRCAKNWREIYSMLDGIALPGGKGFRIDRGGNIVDPTNAPYLLDDESCDVELDPSRTKLPLSK